MKGSQISIDYLSVFRDLAETKSFSKAADKNHLSQSAVSQQLSYLERLFGKKLIERGRGRFALTEAGVSLLNRAHKILKEFGHILDDIHSEPEEILGSIKISAAYSLGLHLLPFYLGPFMKKYPKVHADVEYDRSDHICKDVLAGMSEVGFVVSPCGHHSLIKIIPFQKEKMCIVCSPRHPLAKKTKLQPSALTGESFIHFHPGLQTRRTVDDFLRKNRVQVKVSHEFDNIEMIKRSVEIDNGVSILPVSTIQQELKNKTLKGIPLIGDECYRKTGMILRKDKSHSRATLAFVHYMKSAGNKSVPTGPHKKNSSINGARNVARPLRQVSK